MGNRYPICMSACMLRGGIGITYAFIENSLHSDKFIFRLTPRANCQWLAFFKKSVTSSLQIASFINFLESWLTLYCLQPLIFPNTLPTQFCNPFIFLALLLYTFIRFVDSYLFPYLVFLFLFLGREATQCNFRWLDI